MVGLLARAPHRQGACEKEALAEIEVKEISIVSPEFVHAGRISPSDVPLDYIGLL